MSKKVYYLYNPHTLTYDKVSPTLRDRIYTLLSHAVISIGLGTIFFVVLEYWIQSPAERMRDREIEYLNAQTELQGKRLDEAFEVISFLRSRDNNLYRLLLQAEPNPSDTTLLFSTKYDKFLNMSNGEIIRNNALRIDLLEKYVYEQSNSYDQLINLFKNKEERIRCIPAIMPISLKDLKQASSGFGVRIDPIYRTARMHSGMDFTAQTGTPIYATGDGTVTIQSWEHGYGNTILIDHGHGYRSMYAHLNAFKVKKGQTVRRGEIIGLVGSTGKSTAPHVHYEVHYQGRPVNPVHYYYLDLSPKEYDQMIQIAESAGQTLD